jgi:hypothetical protein
MPYWYTNDPTVVDCPTREPWGVVKEDGETVQCHRTAQDARDAHVAISLAEGHEPRGRWENRE